MSSLFPQVINPVNRYGDPVDVLPQTYADHSFHFKSMFSGMIFVEKLYYGKVIESLAFRTHSPLEWKNGAPENVRKGVVHPEDGYQIKWLSQMLLLA
jgi:hypothetical protein